MIWNIADAHFVILFLLGYNVLGGYCSSIRYTRLVRMATAKTIAQDSVNASTKATTLLDCAKLCADDFRCLYVSFNDVDENQDQANCLISHLPDPVLEDAIFPNVAIYNVSLLYFVYNCMRFYTKDRR